jgi:hypothetical protein
MQMPVRGRPDLSTTRGARWREPCGQARIDVRDERAEPEVRLPSLQRVGRAIDQSSALRGSFRIGKRAGILGQVLENRSASFFALLKKRSTRGHHEKAGRLERLSVGDASATFRRGAGWSFLEG